jgi:hypothetical protein
MSYNALENEVILLKEALAQEQDSNRRLVILREIREADRELVNLIREEQAQLERERDNMQIAINKLNAKHGSGGPKA